MIKSPWILSFFFLFCSNFCDCEQIGRGCGQQERWVHARGKHIYFQRQIKFKTFHQAERLCQGLNGHILQLYPISDVKRILSALWHHGDLKCVSPDRYYWIGVSGFSNGTPEWVDGTKLNVDEYRNYIDIDTNTTSRGNCILLPSCERNATWLWSNCNDTTGYYVTCESQDPCGAQAGIKIDGRDVWKNNTVGIREMKPTEVKCLARGYMVNEKVSYVTLACPGINGGMVGTLVSKAITFSLDSHEKKCVCSITRVDGTKNFSEMKIELLIGPRLEHAGMSPTPASTTYGNDTANWPERLVSGMENESIAIDFVVLANPKPFRCTIKKEPDGTVVSFDKYNWTMVNQSTPLRFDLTIDFNELEYNDTGTYRVILDNGIETKRELRFMLKVIERISRRAVESPSSPAAKTATSAVWSIIGAVLLVEFVAVGATMWYKSVREEQEGSADEKQERGVGGEELTDEDEETSDDGLEHDENKESEEPQNEEDGESEEYRSASMNK